MSSANESFSFIVSKEEQGMRLLAFLKEKLALRFSAKAIKRAIDGKRCQVNGRTELFSTHPLKTQDKIDLKAPVASSGPLEVTAPLFEDEHLLIIDKPVGVVSAILALRSCVTYKGALYLVHRLDKETSGALILAKTKEIENELTALFAQREVEKSYLALVHGAPAKEEGRIENFLGKKQIYQGQAIWGGCTTGLKAITSWKCLAKTNKAALLECQPKTGRTHQLRAHLSEMGHPIIGDCQYAPHFRPLAIAPRILLHAYKVAFVHPKTSERIAVTAPLPADFQNALTQTSLCHAF